MGNFGPAGNGWGGMGGQGGMRMGGMIPGPPGGGEIYLLHLPKKNSRVSRSK